MIPVIEKKDFVYRAELAALHSNDPDTKVGAAVMVPDMREGAPLGSHVIVSTGFNWIDAPDQAHLQRPLKYPYAVHAEATAIAAALNRGVPLAGGAIYVTHPPCPDCAKLIVLAGLKTVIVGSGEFASNTAENGRASAHLLRKKNVVGINDFRTF